MEIDASTLLRMLVPSYPIPAACANPSRATCVKLSNSTRINGSAKGLSLQIIAAQLAKMTLEFDMFPVPKFANRK